MIISDKRKFVFIHNPKTAGTSLRRALVKYHDREVSYWHHLEDIFLDRVIDKAHITMRDFVHMPDYSSIDEYFSFGFVRNPYDRFYSAFQFYKKNNEIFFIYKDNGQGIDEKDLGKIFDPYFTTKEEGKGTGIGLYMSKEIISNQMNGDIYAHNVKYEYMNKEYSGCEFVISLSLKKKTS